MRSPGLVPIAGLCLCLAVCAVDLRAQASTASGVSRPSDQGPSGRVGRTGGQYTREASAPAAGRSFSGAPGASVSLPNLPSRAGRSDPLPAEVLAGRSRRLFTRSTSSLLRPFPGVSITAIERMSGFTAAIDLSAPVDGWKYYTPPELETVATPQTSGDSFNDFFGLRPAAAAEQQAKDEEFDRLLHGLERDQQQRKQEREQMARDLFKAGTTPTNENRMELLAQAERMAISARDMDERAVIPCLIVAHAALEREQMVLALNNIMMAARRDPAIFRDRVDVAGLFGDPNLLDQQMRRFVRTAEFNSEAIQAHLLTAYCAWMLRDESRLRPALKTLGEVPIDVAGQEEIQRFVRAMQASLTAR